MSNFPRLAQVVLDTTDARRLAEFYRQFLGFRYRPGDEPPPAGADDERGRDWLVLLDPEGRRALAFQQVERLKETTWPAGDVPQQMHLDTIVPDKAELDRQHDRALRLGATLRYDRSADEGEPLRVYTDPAGHLFCVFVATALPSRPAPGRPVERPLAGHLGFAEVLDQLDRSGGSPGFLRRGQRPEQTVLVQPQPEPPAAFAFHADPAAREG